MHALSSHIGVPHTDMYYPAVHSISCSIPVVLGPCGQMAKDGFGVVWGIMYLRNMTKAFSVFIVKQILRLNSSI